MEISESQKEYFWSRVDILGENDCWEWKAGTIRNGYGKLKINGKWYLSHRIGFLIKFGHFPVPCGLHTCDNPRCCNPNHIFEGTNKDNTQDMIKKGRRGIRKLTIEQAEYAKSFVPKRRGDLTNLAKKFGVSLTTLIEIRSGRNWKGI